MTLDEAIAHARKVAKEKRKDYERACALNVPSEGFCECASEHEQLAKWLEELKRYKAQKLVIKVDQDKAHSLKELLQYSQFGIAYPEDQYEVVPLVSDGWIPVSERLPDKEGRCLVFTDYGDVTMDSYIDGMFVCNLGNVTHWRPLPKAPESEAEDEDLGHNSL